MCVTERPSFSQQNSSLLLLSSPHPLFILSSHLISPPLILRFRQEAPGSTSMSLQEKGGDGQTEGEERRQRKWQETGWRGGQRKGKGEKKKEQKKGNHKKGERGKQGNKKSGERDRERWGDRERGVSNYRTPSVFKPHFYLTLPVAERKKRQRKEGGGGGGEEDLSPSFSWSQTTGTSHPHHTHSHWYSKLIKSFCFKDALSSENHLKQDACVRALCEVLQ